MKFQSVRASLLFLLLTSYLLLCPGEALASARDGLLLWYRSIVPVLFPFLLLGDLAIRLSLLDPLLKFVYRPLHLLFGCSFYGSYAVLAGFLCGFPVGARLTCGLKKQGKISETEARLLVSFVNNVSPAFLLSYLAADQLNRPELGIVCLGNVLGASALYGILHSLPHRLRARRNTFHAAPDAVSATPCPAGNASDKEHTAGSGILHFAELPSHSTPRFSLALLDDCIDSAAHSLVKIGAYLILFSILTGAALQLLPDSHPVTLILVSSLEVSKGVQLLAASGLSFPVKLLLTNALCTFGGCSALAQSFSLGEMDRELRFSYTKSRVYATLLSCLLTIGLFLSRVCGSV